MKRILFVCHGNICRSPMAEYIMKYITKDSDDYYIDSCATSYEEIGNDLYYAAKETLDKHHIPYGHHRARHIERSDYEKYDYIIGMDQENMDDLRWMFTDNSKIYSLLSFSNLSRDVIDPWYSRKFEDCYEDLYRGCMDLYKYLENK